jgi:hypothetical protein
LEEASKDWQDAQRRAIWRKMVEVIEHKPIPFPVLLVQERPKPVLRKSLKTRVRVWHEIGEITQSSVR